MDVCTGLSGKALFRQSGRHLRASLSAHQRVQPLSLANFGSHGCPLGFRTKHCGQGRFVQDGPAADCRSSTVRQDERRLFLITRGPAMSAANDGPKQSRITIAYYTTNTLDPTNHTKKRIRTHGSQKGTHEAPRSLFSGDSQRRQDPDGCNVSACIVLAGLNSRCQGRELAAAGSVGARS
jgi:hypothetical protein